MTWDQSRATLVITGSKYGCILVCVGLFSYDPNLNLSVLFMYVRLTFKIGVLID